MALSTIQKRIALGLCPSCGAPRDNETTRCSVCRDKHAAQNKLRHARLHDERKATGLCLDCGAPAAGATRCPRCSAKHAKYNRKAMADRTAAWDSVGLCIQCGQPRDNETKRCAACRERHNIDTAEGNRARTENRNAAGVCTICGGPRDELTKVCRSCLALASARNYRTRAARKKEEGLCRHCGKPTLSPNTPKCRYHFTYAILHNFLPRVEPAMVELIAAKLEQQEFKCALSGVPLVPGKNASLDHVYPKLKYPAVAAEPTNLVWVDHTLNKMKQDADPDDPVVAAVFATTIVEKLQALAKLVVFPA